MPAYQCSGPGFRGVCESLFESESAGCGTLVVPVSSKKVSERVSVPQEYGIAVFVADIEIRDMELTLRSQMAELIARSWSYLRPLWDAPQCYEGCISKEHFGVFS